MFVWDYGWFENAQTLMLDMLSMVFHLRTFFMDDYLFFKSPLLFFHSVLVLPNTAWIYRSKYGKFFKVIFQACQKFHSNPFPQHHFVLVP